MGRKEKVSVEEKLRAIKAYISGEKSVAQICSDFCICKQSFRTWIRKYNMRGENGVGVTHKNNSYSEEVKCKAVRDYIDGKGSLEHICTKYNISAIGSLHQWIKKYNSHKILKSHNKQGDKIMTNGRKTTYEERIEIVAFCISTNDDYQVTADKFKVSYQQVYAWVRKYEANGYEALMDRRGKRKEAAELTESEKLSVQLKLIESENTRLKMEIDFLKKLKEVERRR